MDLESSGSILTLRSLSMVKLPDFHAIYSKLRNKLFRTNLAVPIALSLGISAWLILVYDSSDFHYPKAFTLYLDFLLQFRVCAL